MRIAPWRTCWERDAELATLDAAGRSAERGVGGAVLLSGQAGHPPGVAADLQRLLQLGARIVPPA